MKVVVWQICSLPFAWPVFTRKDKLADWFGSYARIMELHIWNSTTLTDAKWDDRKREWTVTLIRRKTNGEEETRVLHPRHVIQATGHSSEMKMPSIKGMNDFQSDRL